MLKKVSHLLSYCILYVFILFLAVFYRQPLFLFLLMLLIALPPASYFVCRYVSRSLRSFLKSSSLYGISGGTVTISVGLHNPTLFPIPDCTLSYRITSSYYPCDEIFLCNIPAYSRKDSSFDMPVTFQKSGGYRIELTEIQFYDYLHFFSYEKKISMQKEIIIHPKTVSEVSFDSSAFGEGFDEFEETGAKGLVSSNVTDIREYIPGDRLQRIHWKLSAKINKLMVKENEQTSTHQFTVLVELFLPEPSSSALEQSLSYGLSMAQELLKAGESFFFCYYSINEADFIKHLVQNKEDLDRALLECFYQTPYDRPELALQILEKTDILKGTILHVSEKGVNDIVF